MSVAAGSPPFGERLRRLRSKRNEDWWHIVFGGPVATILNAFIAEVRWITPNALTWLSFLTKLAALPLLLERRFPADVAVAVLLQVSSVLDVMDGSLARYRKRSSLEGAFLDKVTDAIGLVAVAGTLGYRVYLDGAGVGALFAATFIGVSYLGRAYMFWIVAFYERERAAAPTAGPALRRDFGELTFGERLGYYLRSTWRIFAVGEADIYLWMCVGLLVGRLVFVVWALAAAMAFWFVVITGYRYVTVRRLDAGSRS